MNTPRTPVAHHGSGAYTYDLYNLSKDYWAFSEIR